MGSELGFPDGWALGIIEGLTVEVLGSLVGLYVGELGSVVGE